VFLSGQWVPKRFSNRGSLLIFFMAGVGPGKMPKKNDPVCSAREIADTSGATPTTSDMGWQSKNLSIFVILCAEWPH
jgi:hypothetical protein